MKAIVVEQTGGPDVLRLKDVPSPEPGPGQALIRIAAAGINYIDTYHRTGLYKLPLPFIPGNEGSGTVESVAADAANVKRGDRVAWAVTPSASYAEYAVVPARQLVPVPPNIDLETGAAAMLQGMTAHYLTHSTYALKPGHACLIHAAAGGVGLLVVQMAKQLGAFVIGTASTDEKRQLARDAGADQVVPYDDFPARVREFTEGRGVEVVYDSVGKDTFARSLECLKPRGLMVTFGQSSGPIGQIDPLILSQRGSLYLTRPTLAHYTATREELLWRAGDILSGSIDYRIGGRYPLAEARRAHEDLQARRTTGKLILTV
jgi:NADPH2:quinone reductase